MEMAQRYGSAKYSAQKALEILHQMNVLTVMTKNIMNCLNLCKTTRNMMQKGVLRVAVVTAIVSLP